MVEGQSKRNAIVVGGGVIGLACAHYLSQAGIGVRVLDRGKIGGECSHANCGYVCPSHVLPLTVPSAVPMATRSFFKPRSPFKIQPRLNARYWKWMFQFAIRCRKDVALSAGHHLKAILDSSIDEYRQLVRNENLRCQWRESGLLHVFETKKAFEACRRENDMVVAEFEHGAREVSSDELVEIAPALKRNLAGGFLHEGDAILRPDLLNRQWRERLESSGVQFIEQCELLNVSRCGEGDVEHLETSTGNMSADTYVFAMGAWSEKLGDMTGFKLPIQPGKGYSITLEKKEFYPTMPMLFPEKKIGISPFEDGFRIGSMMEFVGFDHSIPEYRIEQLKRSVRPFFDVESNAIELERWSGFRPMTYDTLPAIGNLPSSKNGFVATGHSMLGISMAPATGRLIAELVQGNKTHLNVTPYDPVRFQ
ncbi:FAD-dependent oxidoreductase [bacterium]|nr:FAD-dependent oxidoreductase [bacterium]